MPVVEILTGLTRGSHYPSKVTCPVIEILYSHILRAAHLCQKAILIHKPIFPSYRVRDFVYAPVIIIGEG